MKERNLTGMQFERWTVLYRVGSKRGQPLWKCLCECGATGEVVRGALVSGTSRSCGCLRSQEVSARMSTHGHTKGGTRHPLYRTWVGMRNRCGSLSNADYGARGIKVCERWNDFPTFLADVGERPPGTSLDRIDNDGHYEPSNVRWATPLQQVRNRRNSIIQEYVW